MQNQHWADSSLKETTKGVFQGSNESSLLLPWPYSWKESSPKALYYRALRPHLWTGLGPDNSESLWCWSVKICNCKLAQALDTRESTRMKLESKQYTYSQERTLTTTGKRRIHPLHGVPKSATNWRQQQSTRTTTTTTTTNRQHAHSPWSHYGHVCGSVSLQP